MKTRVLLSLALLSFAGCPPQVGTDAGTQDSGQACTAPTDCPATGNDCLQPTCSNGTCGTAPVASGTRLTMQTAGDCLVVQCDGAGNRVSVNDATDVQDDGNECTVDACGSTGPTHTNSTAGAACGTGGTLKCDGQGACVGCLTATDCPGSDTECQTRTCTAGTCGFSYVAAGTATTTQTAGDCKQQQCDGQGGLTDVALTTDLPDDSNACTEDSCNGATPVNAPAMAGAACSAGGTVCDGAGACVACNVAADCTGTSTFCRAVACTAHQCGFTNTAANTALPTQTAGDCRRAVCDGNGAETTANDDADVQNDNNLCTTDSCNAGTPVHAPVTSGTTCGTGLVCNGAAQCVGCLVANDCPGTDTQCRTRTCTAGTCGFSFATAGTQLSTQTAGDCQRVVCDGSGNTTSNADNGDLPVDGQQCTQDVCTSGVPSNPPTASGAMCNQNGGALCNGAGACVACVVNTDCGAATQCATPTCTAGVCSTVYVAAGTPVTAQTAGDCRQAQCNGTGGVQSAIFNSDVPVDGNQCTQDVCVAGSPANPPVASGGACTQNGGSVCNGTGSCVQCVTAASCPGTDTQCQTRTCTAGTCGFSYAAAGTVLTAQTAGDCRQDQCNGSGGTQSAIFNSDVPVDGNQCTQDVCTAGTPSNPPVGSGTTCSQNGGALCNGAGACVQCLAVSDCPGASSECATVTCTANACGTVFTAAGTPLAAQTAGDCRQAQCNGSGGTQSGILNSDLPVDGNQCTSDVCTAGTPSNPPVGSGTACTQGGGSLCNGAGACVQCLAASDCPGTDTECQARSCNSGACGMTFTASGTAVTAQTLGDCKQNVCNGAGAIAAQNDDADVPVDGNQCTQDVCTAGVPSNPGVTPGSTCTQNGGRVCTASGTCVECLAAADCPGVSSECATITCSTNTCGVNNAAAGTVMTAQTAGDCRQNQCDGSGGTTAAVLDTDVPVDGLQCTSDVCTSGTPSNPAAAPSTPCSQNGGAYCDGAGACVECVTGAQCASLVCSSGHCQPANCMDMIKNGPETDVDCGGGVCAGCGLTKGCVTGNDCLSRVCTALACTAPVVTATTPANGATGVALTGTVSFTLSAGLKASTVTVQSTAGTCTGSFQVSADGFVTCVGLTGLSISGATATATISPTLASGTRYQLRVTTAVQDAASEALAASYTTPTGFFTVPGASSCQVVISQVYGGGGNSGAPYKSDFIELKNQGTTTVSLLGWSVQYASATGSTWQTTPLDGGIAPGGYFLVQQAYGADAGVFLPTPDAIGTIAMAGTGGKVALVNGTALLSGACPTSATIVDMVGFGAANCSETAPTPAPSNTMAVVRVGASCVESNTNSADFVLATPTPRNTATAAAWCSACGVQNESNNATEADYCNLQFPISITASAGTTSPSIYGRIYEAGVTEAVGPNATVLAQVGYGPEGVDPRTQCGWLFFPATYNTQVGNDDEYQGSFTVPAVGTWRYTFRFSIDNGATWTFGDLDGAGANAGLTFDLAQLPVLTAQ